MSKETTNVTQIKRTESTAIGGDFITFRLAEQLLGIPVLEVHDVLASQKITPIPLAPHAVAGVLNLRGRIVTAIDLRARLGLSARKADDKPMSIVIEHNGEPYSLLIDKVGEVLSLTAEHFERNPVTLDACWQSVSSGIYRLDGELLVAVNVDRLLDFAVAAAA